MLVYFSSGVIALLVNNMLYRSDENTVVRFVKHNFKVYPLYLKPQEILISKLVLLEEKVHQVILVLNFIKNF